MAMKRSRLLEILQDESKTPAEKTDLIIEEHLSVVNPMKDELATLREQTDTLANLQQEVEKLTGQGRTGRYHGKGQGRI